MRGISEYMVMYKMHEAGEVEHIHVYTLTKEETYDYVVYEFVPSIEGKYPYSAWVKEVHYLNGKIHVFNTHEGKPY